MGERIVKIGHRISLTLPPDVDDIIQRERQKLQNHAGYKPPRGVIIAEAIRAYYGGRQNAMAAASAGGAASVIKRKRA
jgi:hypothetical protein